MYYLWIIKAIQVYIIKKNANNKRTIKILSLDIADGLWSTRAALDGSTLRHHNESIKWEKANHKYISPVIKLNFGILSVLESRLVWGSA